MPRIRTLKPEHKGHRKVGRLSDRAYRLWVGLITEADDEGRIVLDLGHFRAAVFPYQKPSEALVGKALQEALDLGLLHRYEVEGIAYLWFPSWHEHQKIDRRRPSTLPAPFDERSMSHRRPFVEPSTMPRAVSILSDPTDRSNDRILPTEAPPDGLSATNVRIGDIPDTGPDLMARILDRQKVLRRAKGYEP